MTFMIRKKRLLAQKWLEMNYYIDNKNEILLINDPK